MRGATRCAGYRGEGSIKGGVTDFALRVWVRTGPAPSAAPTTAPSAVPSSVPSARPTVQPTTAEPTTRARGLPAPLSRLVFRSDGTVTDVVAPSRVVSSVGALNVSVDASGQFGRPVNVAAFATGTGVSYPRPLRLGTSYTFSVWTKGPVSFSSPSTVLTRGADQYLGAGATLYGPRQIGVRRRSTTGGLGYFQDDLTVSTAPEASNAASALLDTGVDLNAVMSSYVALPLPLAHQPR
jgi:hypothetical protein